MAYDTIISLDAYRQERERADDIWSNYDVFEETRSPVPLQELVADEVSGLYVDQSGPDSVEKFRVATQEEIRELVSSGAFIPSGLPQDVQSEFKTDLAETVAEYAVAVYERVDEIDSVSESDIDTVISEVVPEKY